MTSTIAQFKTLNIVAAMFTVPPSISAQPASRAVCAHANASQLRSRRNVLGLPLVAAPLFSGAAMALIPDDDDEEMVEKAKANRKKKLQEVRYSSKATCMTLALCGNKPLTGQHRASS